MFVIDNLITVSSILLGKKIKELKTTLTEDLVVQAIFLLLLGVLTKRLYQDLSLTLTLKRYLAYGILGQN